jgi:hypothetical protein
MFKVAGDLLVSKYIPTRFVRKTLSLLQDDGPTRSDVASAVAMSLLIYILDGDKIMESLARVYYARESIVVLPVLTTNLESHLSSESVMLRGTIWDDGGGVITSSGIAWSTHYSPTVNDQVLPSNATEGTFFTTLTGLTEGTSYYARSFATNSAGTAYGNNLEFTPSASQGDAPPKVSEEDFRIFPNPAASHARIRFYLDSPREVSLLVYDMKGSLVAQVFQGRMPAGENHLDMDLSSLEDASYICKLDLGNTQSPVRTLVVRRNH